MLLVAMDIHLLLWVGDSGKRRCVARVLHERPGSGAPAKARRGRSWSKGLAGLYCVLALVGCAPPPIADGGTASRRATTVPHTASTVRHPAIRVSHTSTASTARIPRPDRSLLVLQQSPDCEFKGLLSNPMTAEETRMKLDYEEQCYRQSESIARTRLQQLQKSVEEVPRPDRSWLVPQAPPDCGFKGPLNNPMTAEETRIKLDYEQQCYRQAESITRTRLQQLQNSISDATKSTSRRKVTGKRHKYVRHPGSGNHRASGHLHHSTHRTI